MRGDCWKFGSRFLIVTLAHLFLEMESPRGPSNRVSPSCISNVVHLLTFDRSSAKV
uniref:Uncharacterized protein n=1 Tax=Setaria viridis TaxID=4556 RepID=A0A4U6VAT2_SETVI|nr:hypothetical protein SEVIR_4G188001v2 [Setaria viridis]